MPIARIEYELYEYSASILRLTFEKKQLIKLTLLTVMELCLRVHLPGKTEKSLTLIKVLSWYVYCTN